MKEVRIVVHTERQDISLEYLINLVTLYLNKMISDIRDEGKRGIYYDITEEIEED